MLIVQLALDVQAARSVGARRRENEALLALRAEVDQALSAQDADALDGLDAWAAIERVRGIMPAEESRRT